MEIARAIAAGTRCLLLDEPTAALERDAIARLFDRVRQLVASGVAVLYISHHLEEVFEICQDVAVIRDGEIVLTAATASRDQGAARRRRWSARPGARGWPADERPRRRRRAAVPARPLRRPVRHRPAGSARRLGDAARLTVDRVSAESPRGSLRDVSLEIAPGERVGITGLLSAGVATLARVVAGRRSPTSPAGCWSTAGR